MHYGRNLLKILRFAWRKSDKNGQVNRVILDPLASKNPKIIKIKNVPNKIADIFRFIKFFVRSIRKLSENPVKNPVPKSTIFNSF